MEKQEFTMTKEKDTKNTVRYSEDEGHPPVISNMYIKKWLSPPRKIKVTIEPVEE